jgi:phage tail P2-like protein
MSTPGQLIVTGAGNGNVNGVYDQSFQFNDRPTWVKGNFRIWAKQFISFGFTPSAIVGWRYVIEEIVPADLINGTGSYISPADSWLGDYLLAGSGTPVFPSPAPTVAAYVPPAPPPDPPDLLPPNSTSQERALSKTTARVGDVPMQIKQVWNPQTCPAGILPWLAWAMSVDEWDANWTEQQKRDAIAASVQVHRTKGTIGAVRRALQALGYEVLVNENTGTPYTFRLQVDIGDSGGSDDIYNEAERIALRTKNARSHLLGVDALGQIRGVSRIGSVGIDGNTTRRRRTA